MFDYRSLSSHGEEQEFVVERHFSAPRTLMFQVFTQLDHLKRWWAPQPYTLPICTIDLQPGGIWHYCMRGPSGQDHWVRNVYREIVSPEKLVYTSTFAEEHANPIEGIPEHLTTIIFTQEADKTRVSARVHFANAADLKAALDMGMLQGMNMTWDDLVEYVQELCTSEDGESTRHTPALAGLEKRSSLAQERRTKVPTEVSAEQFVEQVRRYRSGEKQKEYEHHFQTGEGHYGEGDQFLGVRMGQVFELAKGFTDMPPQEIEQLLISPIHELRVGALSIMDKQARRKTTPECRRKELFDLYFRHIDKINNWDLVDLGCPYVVGGYLLDKPRDLLYQLAHSHNIWQRRTAIVSTSFFLKQGQVADTFHIAQILLHDEHDLIHKAVGGWIREAGKHDRAALLRFLDTYAATMPRVTLRYAIEHLDAGQRAHYLSMKGKAHRR